MVQTYIFGITNNAIAFVERSQTVSATHSLSIRLAVALLIRHASLPRSTAFNNASASAPLFINVDAASSGMIQSVSAWPIREPRAFRVFIAGVIRPATAFAKLSQTVCAEPSS